MTDYGEVPKRSTGADCKSAGVCLRRFESFPLHQAFSGAFARRVDRVCIVTKSVRNAGVAQLVRASAFQAEGREFESRLPLHFVPRARAIRGATRAANAHVAQLVEHVLGKDEVTGSIPVVGSTGFGCPAA